MRLYAIRQISTGFFLPQKEYGKMNKAFTWDEPKEGCVPRLFQTKIGAERALGFWLRGRVLPTRYQPPNQRRRLPAWVEPLDELVDAIRNVQPVVDAPAIPVADGPVPLSQNRRRKRRKIGKDQETGRYIYGDAYETQPRYVEPVATRNPEDMEVVEFNMVELQPPVQIMQHIGFAAQENVEFPRPDAEVLRFRVEVAANAEVRPWAVWRAV